MCKFKSGIITKNKVFLAPEGNESHSYLLRTLGIEDTRENAMRKFIRAELIPKDNNKATDVSKWRFNVDQDITPDWYDEDPKRYEEEFRDIVKDYMKKYEEKYNLIKIGDYYWNPVVDGNKTYYFMDGILFESKFGKNNNYAESYVREKLNNSDLAKELKELFGDKLVPITTDLLSLDGLDDYGKVEGDILAIPTIDLYRKFRNKITKIDKWWWLATPESTPSGYSSDNVNYVSSGSYVDYNWHNCVNGVRPFFILQS